MSLDLLHKIVNPNRTEFLRKYTGVLLEKMHSIKTTNLDGLIKQTTDLTKYSNLILEINNRILETKEFNSLNIGLIKMLIIG